jgi:hypothetical protein
MCGGEPGKGNGEEHLDHVVTSRGHIIFYHSSCLVAINALVARISRMAARV